VPCGLLPPAGAAIGRLVVDEVAQPLSVSDIRSVTGFPNCALKEPDPVKVADLRGRAIDLTTDRFGAPDQIAFGIDFGLSGYLSRIISNIARHGECASVWRHTSTHFQFER
jgi:hypothetical protein